MKIKYYYYKITNTINNKYYIGITTEPKERKRRHFYNLKNNIHENEHLQNSYNKYGEEHFIFEIIEIKETDSIQEAYDHERALIEKYGARNRSKGYNIAIGGFVSPAISEEVREKRRKTEEAKVDDVVQISMETMQVIKQYPSIRSASRETNINRSAISAACNRQLIQAGGYYWSFANNYYNNNWVPLLNKKYIPIGEYENNKLIKVFDSAASAGRYYDLDRSNIRASIKRNGSCGGRIFKQITHKEYYNFLGYKQPVETRIVMDS